MQKSFSI